MESQQAPTPEQRQAAVTAAAVAMLQEQAPGTITRDGVPNMAALSEKVGFTVSSEERKAAMASIAANAGAEAPDDDLPDLDGAGDAPDLPLAGPDAAAPDPLAALPPVDKVQPGPQPPAVAKFPGTLYHATLPHVEVKTPAEWRAAQAKGFRDLADFPMPERKAIHQRAQRLA